MDADERPGANLLPDDLDADISLLAECLAYMTPVDRAALVTLACAMGRPRPGQTNLPTAPILFADAEGR